LNDADLKPFVSSDIGDIFHYLYYGGRLDVLRGVCRRAKRSAEGGFKIRFDCHMVMDETVRIVASTL
jgi:hypothetical protein